MKDVTADQFDLMKQAPQTIEYYYSEIEGFLEDIYGKGWGKSHPEAVARLVDACARDYHSASVLSGLQNVRDKLGEIADSIGSIKDIADAIKQAQSTD